MARNYPITPYGEGWRKELAECSVAWTDRNLDDIHQAIESDVYNRALNGQKLAHVARWYGANLGDFTKAYGQVWGLGHSELMTAIAQKTIEAGLKGNQPVSLIWLGKSIGGLSESGVSSVEGTTDDDGSVNIKVNIVRRESTDEQ